VTFLNHSHADMVKLSAWYVYRRSVGVLHYLDTAAGYHGGLKRCGLGSDESQPTHRLSHGFSYAYMRHVWHKCVLSLPFEHTRGVHAQFITIHRAPALRGGWR
jgi:hypothetical protein